MSDEVSLREHFESQWRAHEREHQLLAENIELARNNLQADVGRTREAMEARLAVMNEFRATIADQSALSVTRDEFDRRVKQLERLVWMGTGVVLFAAAFAVYFIKGN